MYFLIKVGLVFLQNLPCWIRLRLIRYFNNDGKSIPITLVMTLHEKMYMTTMVVVFSGQNSCQTYLSRWKFKVIAAKTQQNI
jgi:hypothetical protein